MSLTHKSQSALEYMMTYGWAILVIVIVAAVLYSLGIFSPSSSLSTTITGFSNLGTVNAVCLGGTSFTISMGDSTGYPINITQINLTSSSGKTTYSPNVLIQPNAIQTVTVPSSSLCTAGARYSISVVVTYLEPGQIFPGPYTSTGTVAGTANSIPSSATSYEPLTITNSQNQGTPTPFQQMINVTSSSPGWADISSSPFGQNVEFFSSTGQILDSWLENYTSTHAIWWVKLTASIPAGSRQTIYMGFAPTSTNLFNTVNDGEAPQIPCGSTSTSSCSNYAEYDDGANVFTEYENFAGTSLSSKWGTSGSPTITVDNGLTLGGSADSYIGTTSYVTSSLVVYDVDWKETPSSSSLDYGMMIDYTVSSNTGYLMRDSGFDGTNTADWFTAYNNGFTEIGSASITLPTQTNMHISESLYNSPYGYVGENYTFAQYGSSSTAYNSGGVGLRIGTTGAQVFVQWLRTRAYPPNGVMPSVSFGSVS